MTRPVVLVLGANGRLGAAAVQAFSRAGWKVLAQVRRPPAQPLPAGVQQLATPLHDTAALVASAVGARTVVYGINPIYTRWDQEALPLARLGMDVAERLGATFMLPGNVYNFGEQMPPLLRTDTPQRPTTVKGRQRCDLEGEIEARSHAGRMRGTVIRAGDFFGGGAGSWLDQAIVKSLAKGKLVYPGPLDAAHAWAYLPDLARAFVAVASVPQRQPFQALHFAGHSFTGRQLLAHIETAADTLGLRPARGWRHRGMPWTAVRAIGLVVPLWRELARMRYLWQVPHALDATSLLKATGRLPTTPPDEALRAALAGLGFRRSAGVVARAAAA